MNIRQMNFQFQPEEDRIVLRMNTTTGEAFGFHLTRRFVKALWPVLRKLLAEELKRRAPEQAHAADSVLAFEQEKAVSQANFRAPYDESAQRQPLGETPVLLSRIQVKTGGAGPILCLHPSRGAGIELPATPGLLHMVCKPLKDIAARADWNLDLPLPAEKPVGARQNRVLH